jgi:diguanylate cyclase (GGDEF)-like protein
VVVEDTGRWYADARGRPARAEGIVRIINERHRREQQMAFLSRYDELTGQLTRANLIATLDDALNAAMRLRTALAFMIIALDDVPAINEAYGFEVADQLLAAAAARVRTTLRQGDTLGRFSGTKLAVILRNCEEGDMAAAAVRLQAAVSGDVIVTSVAAVAATVSVGAVALPRHGRSANEAVAHAQEALHLASQRGRGRFAAYQHSLERVDARRTNASLSADLVAAFNENRFVLEFQPVAQAATRAIAFSEALIRVQRPGAGLRAAADFIATSERLGLIRLVDQRTPELVLAALTRAPQARLAFNISAETVDDAHWLARIKARLEGHRDLASRLIVEITETAMMRDLDAARRAVEALHELGCRVALDDFGSGFSSFRALRTLGADIVKIDGAYIEALGENRQDRVFTRALIDLARSAGMETVAERVKDEETARLLREWGVDYLQGRLIGEGSLDNPPAVGNAAA